MSGWFVQRHLESERQRIEGVATERMGAWAELVQRSLPAADADPEQQAAALREWSQRLRLPLALDDASGQRIGASDSFLRREADSGRHGAPVRLDDGRTLWMMRPGAGRGFGAARAAAGDAERAPGPPGEGGPPRPKGIGWPAMLLPPQWPPGVGLLALLALLFVAVAAGAYPVVRRLTRRLESLKAGVERFGAGRSASASTNRGATRWPRWRAASTWPPRASRRWCARTRACSPMPATSCARRWRA